MALNLRAIGNVHPALRAMLVGEVLTTLAQMISLIAIPWWVTQQGGAQDLVSYGIAIAVVTFVSQPLVAPFSERYAKRTQLIFGIAATAITGMLLAAVATIDGYNFHVVIAVSLAAVVANAFVSGASAAITPELVPPAELPEALALRKRAASAGRLVGPLVGGALLASVGTAATFWTYFGLLALATFVLCMLPRPTSKERRAATGGTAQWWIEFTAGMKAKWAVPIERGWTLVNFLVWVFIGPAFNLFVPLKISALGLSSTWMGACEASISVGMLLGSFGISTYLVHRFGRYPVRVCAAVSEGILLSVVGIAHQSWLLILAFGCAGFANTIMVLVGSTHRTLAIPKEFRVRMTSVNAMSTQVASALGPLLAGIALAHWPLPAVYSGFCLLASLMAVGFVLIPRSREFFELDHDQVVDWYRREYPEGFATPGVTDPLSR
ncbi:TPA: MFS transporter [Burkholderia cenocepacia]|uniref:MFS transporter n=1 Tax=unclassified Burkholderia TaxID=2613784 RepID=UPI001588D404|nr:MULTISPECIES: MFS transporter [unclassified Burkholderia]HEF5873695.1 MFS transporter [Burkholderia cenocepacia]